MSDEEESSEFADNTTEGEKSESNLTEETISFDTRTRSTTDTFGATTDSEYETEKQSSKSETSARSSRSETNDGSLRSETSARSSRSETNDGSSRSETTDISSISESSKCGEESADEEFVDSEWNEQNFLLPEDIFNLESRRIRSEDPFWALSPVPELAAIIIRAVKFIDGFGLESLKANAETEQWRQILEILPLTLPFEYSLPVIEDGVYWKRHCVRKWPATDIWCYGDSWKTMLIERIVQEKIETFNPENSEIIELERFLKKFQNYNSRLQIEELVRTVKKPFVVDLSSEDFDDLLDEFINKPEVHASFIDFEKVLESLLNLKEFSLVLTPGYLDPETHHLSFTDYNSVLKGVSRLQKLQKFRCSNGVATNAQLSNLSRNFMQHKYLKELNMSYNFIDDEICDDFGRLLISNCPLEVLILKYNRISDRGAISIASALSVNTKLRKLDISLNWIGNQGGSFLAKVVTIKKQLEDLDISNNKLGRESGFSFAEVVKVSKHIRNLNLSHNNIGNAAGKELRKAMEENSTILDFGIKFCNLLPQDEDNIHRAIIRNRVSTYPSNEEDFFKRLKF